MSQESASAEEAAEVIRLLEGIRTRRDAPRPSGLALAAEGRSGSPMGTRSPVRSMLDVSGGPSHPRHASIAVTGVGVTNMARSTSGTGQPRVRSMLDPPDESTPSNSLVPSPPLASPNNEGRFYDRTDSPAGAPRLLGDRSRRSENSTASPNPDYQFDLQSSSYHNSVPLRPAKGSKKFSRQAAISALINSSDRKGRETDRGRHNSIAGTNLDSHKHSKSPASRSKFHSGRSQSPRRSSMLNTNSYNLMGDPGKFVSDKGQVIDLNNAYRRLSDAALARSSGSLANLPTVTGSEHIRADSGEALSPSGGVRLQKDYYPDDEDALADSSDEPMDSSDEEFYGRGRARDRDGKGKRSPGTKSPSDARAPKSLLAAAEEERQEISSAYKVKSLLGPEVQVTSPSGEKLSSKKAGVHPSTSFDRRTTSGAASPRDTDTEEEENMDDIRRAQRLQMITSPISATPHRCVRTVIRGEFQRFQKEADEGLRRQRSYLVATDLSDEAAHALEWTIGTVLRDGDTLIAIFAVDAEDGIAIGQENEPAKGTDTPVHKEHSHTKERSASRGHGSKKSIGGTPVSPAHSRVVNSSKSQPGSPDGRARDKAESERIHATEEITERIIRLLRKTKLQIRTIVEVIYCATPKHTICSMIDHVSPTLVVLGSRGRSALKGVLLGSFSNYLVQKSSVPVMVARKRLRKGKFKRPANPRLANNLTSPSGEQGMNLRLSSAKID